MAGSKFSTGATVDVGAMRRFASAVRKASPEFAVQLKVGLLAAGDIVAQAARDNASWSSRIPGSIKPLASGSSVRVRAGGARAPHAAPYEHGGQPGDFRHPVFGRDVWVSQQARPFLGPALDDKSDEVAAACDAAMDAVIELAVSDG